jgi:F-type H+-transporting ATPase subunit a
MVNRNTVAWLALALAVVLAIVAVVVGEEWVIPPMHEHDPFAHVGDSTEWAILESLGWTFHLPGWLSKFAVLEIVAALIIMAVFIPLCRRLASGRPARGAWENAMESVLTFIRNDIARPNLGERDADRYVPLLWTLFLFVLVCNLLGMLPWLGSPTANLYVTGALALVAFVMMHAAPAYKMGVGRYLQSLWPHVEIVQNPWRPAGAGPGHDGHGHADHGHDGHGHGKVKVPAGPARQPATSEVAAWVAGSVFGFGLSLMICLIEVFGTVIKSGVLAVRLFANMFAGHTVLAMILSFIIMAANAIPLLWGSITFASVLGVVALSLLELFVAFLQSYIFVFLTALFMGMALNPQH